MNSNAEVAPNKEPINSQLTMSDILSVKYIFGYSGHLKNNIHHLSDEKSNHSNRIMYTAGHNIVFYNTDSCEQVYIHGTEGTSGITCLTMSPSKKYLAFAEEADVGIIYVYELDM